MVRRLLLPSGVNPNSSLTIAVCAAVGSLRNVGRRYHREHHSLAYVDSKLTPAACPQVDLETEQCPTLSLNFLKLCKAFKYNFCSFHNVIQDFIAQTGDPTDTGKGGASIFHQLPPSSPAYQSTPYFVPDAAMKLKHSAYGTLSMAVAGEGDQRGCGSQFFFTLAENLDYLDGKHAPFGRAVEGQETLAKINEALTDQEGRPLRDIRIRHVIVLGASAPPLLSFGWTRLNGPCPRSDDPYDDPAGFDAPEQSPVPTAKQLASLRVGDEEDLEEDGDPDELAQKRREREARAQALTLEMVGDLPFADVAPPENVLFVCKLNAVTTSEDLELIFSRFGEILSCEIIKDQKTGDSLQYAFIEFRNQEDAERAYLKMDNVLVDDRRIHVDFSQVSPRARTHKTLQHRSTDEKPSLGPSAVGLETARHLGLQPNWRARASEPLLSAPAGLAPPARRPLAIRFRQPRARQPRRRRRWARLWLEPVRAPGRGRARGDGV